MSKRFKQEKNIDVTELAEVLSLDDEKELENDIREWFPSLTVQFKEYGFGEADSEEEYLAILNKISDYYLTER